MRAAHQTLAALSLALAFLAPARASATPSAGPPPTQAAALGHADFVGDAHSSDAARVADWVATSGDNGKLPFVIIDKRDARVFVFDGQARLRGATPALLGLARGDDTVPGIGQRKLATILPGERTTPAGRFTASIGRDLEQDILWIDYDAALAMHRVVTGEPGERRLERLASADPLQRRISFGCVNVPAKFYDDVVARTFEHTSGIVYILPESKSVEDEFPHVRHGE